ncbi:NADH:quinone oxidoreductase [Pseudomonas frederiksbergensis]|uniref:NADH:quinone oxidoreductase n=1 Tax=Pseudomonas frederiksbergensis TaxID=104087 RepID=A0A1J0EP32_9PSED|nr:Rnf-Nqr domain containing protein [Pseudomonas frederiksbergensis]APC17790.1 NADH:quinone oxidoreductase [Pseudomonas frederiksbergensis]
MNNSSMLQNSLILTPLIGASDSLVKALSLSLLSLLVIGVYGLKMSILRPRLVPSMQLITSIALAATLTSLATLALQAWAFELHQQLGIYAGLIALQCVALEHSGFFTQARMMERVRQSGLFIGLMVALGVLREGIGNGSFASHLSWLTGFADANGQGWLFAADGGIRLTILAPGGFILLGLLIAAKQAWPGASTSH